MYVFAEPVTEEEVAEIQSQNSAKIQEFERNILGLTHGNSSGVEQGQEVDPKWKKIQADVQKAMENDELSVDGPGQVQEAIGEDAQRNESPTNRPEVFEQGPLYARNSAAGADNDATAASAGNDEEEGDIEDDDDVEVEDEDGREDEDEEEMEKEEEEEEEDRNDNEVREFEESRRQEAIEEFLEGEADISTTDAIEAESRMARDSANEDDAALSKDRTVEFQNDANLLTEGPNEDDAPETAFGQESMNEGAEPKNDGENTWIPPPSSVAEGEDQPEYQIQADQSFLDSINQEVTQAQAAAETSSEDVLAMTLTLRNKVNGEYVLRPDQMTASDEWSIEYSLTEVSERTRAMALYKACQRRRSKKMDAPLVPEDEETVNGYIRKLRELSAQGRRWRQQQDNRDRKMPVQVL